MNDMPLHPIVVHLPLVFAFLVPVVIIAVLVGRAKGWLRPPVWWLVVASGAVLAAGSVFAVKTGEEDEELVEEIVAEAPIEEHEEAAETFMWGSIALLGLLVAIPLVRVGKMEKIIGSLAAVGGITLAVMAVQVGHSGGELIYRYGAADAYSVSAPSPGETTDRSATRNGDDDDEHE